jgi:hypothetical protein
MSATRTVIADSGLRIDAALEDLIDLAYARMVKPGATQEESSAAWTDMAVLIRRRSHTQVMKMELEMRLLRKKVAA